MKHWLFPANWEQFDVLGAFAKFGMLDWRKNCTAEKGDHVYIYQGAPIGKIILKTKVISNQIPNCEFIDDSLFSKVPKNEYLYDLADTNFFIRLLPVRCFLNEMDRLSLEKLRENGLKKNIQGPQILENNPALLAYILDVEEGKSS